MVKEKLKIGDVAEDGWIYAGDSPDTHKPMYVAPKDVGVMFFKEARAQAKKIKFSLFKRARLPSKNELQMIFNNRARISGISDTGTSCSDGYWTSEGVSQHANINKMGLEDAIRFYTDQYWENYGGPLFPARARFVCIR